MKLKSRVDWLVIFLKLPYVFEYTQPSVLIFSVGIHIYIERVKLKKGEYDVSV